MSFSIRRIEYFHTTIRDEPGEGFAVLSALASQSVNLMAFTAVPLGRNETQLTLYPEIASALSRAAAASGMRMDGPHPAILVQGDDELGAIAGIHRQLATAGLNVVSASGVTDGRGSFGYVIHLRPGEVERAAEVLRNAAATSRD